MQNRSQIAAILVVVVVLLGGGLWLKSSNDRANAKAIGELKALLKSDNIAVSPTENVACGDFLLPPLAGWERTASSRPRTGTMTQTVIYKRTIGDLKVSMSFRYGTSTAGHRFPATLAELKGSYAMQVKGDDERAQKYPNGMKIEHLPTQDTQFHGKPALLIQEVTHWGKVSSQEKQLYIGDLKAHYDFRLNIPSDGVPPAVLAEAEREWNKLNATIRPR